MSELNGNGGGQEVQLTNPLQFVMPTPFGTSVGKLTLPDGRAAIQLTFYTATGVTTLVMLPEEGRQVANQLSLASGGLVVPVNADGRLGRPQGLGS